MVYVPSAPPPQQDKALSDLMKWMQEELNEIATAFTSQELLQLETLYEEPEKPRESLIVVADGTQWNPGSGAGLYIYRSGSWVLIA